MTMSFSRAMRPSLSLSSSSFRGQIPPSRPILRTFASGPSDSSNPSSNPPSSFQEAISGFKPFIRPFAKVFLGGIFTFQVIYWIWLKLEVDEVKLEKNKEVAALEKQARDMAGVKK